MALANSALDAGANPHSPLDSLISFHAKGLLMDVSGEEVEFRILTDEWAPYPPVRRSI